MEKLRRKLSQLDAERLANTRKEIAHVKRRVRELENMASSLYEDRVSGKISGEAFSVMVSQNEQERLEKTSHLQELMAEVEAAEQQFSNIEKWAALIRKYQNLQTLDRATIDELIDHIEIGERFVQNGKRCQNVKVIYRFVGQID